MLAMLLGKTLAALMEIKYINYMIQLINKPKQLFWVNCFIFVANCGTKYLNILLLKNFGFLFQYDSPKIAPLLLINAIYKTHTNSNYIKSLLLINPINLSGAMNQSNNGSLLGFLQKKSLFSSNVNNSNRKRSRSRSKDSKNFDKVSNVNSFEEKSLVESAFMQKKQTIAEDSFRNNSNYAKPNPNPESGRLFKTYHEHDNYHDHTFNPNQPRMTYERNIRTTPYEDKNPLYYSKASEISENTWGVMMQTPNNFESARLQSSQCLQNLSAKINSEISGINYKIEAFNAKMAKILNSEFRAVREKIMQVFDAAFKESERYMKEYMAKKEAELAGELIKMREILVTERAKVQAMSEELRKPQWRKVAGEILSSDLQSKVEELIKKSKDIEAGYWELGDIGGYRIKNIESELREIVRLKV